MRASRIESLVTMEMVRKTREGNGRIWSWKLGEKHTENEITDSCQEINKEMEV